jgi:hypothetical protein
MASWATAPRVQGYNVRVPVWAPESSGETTLEAAATETSCALILLFARHTGVPVSATQTIRLHHRSRGYQTYFRCASGNREPDLSRQDAHIASSFLLTSDILGLIRSF